MVTINNIPTQLSIDSFIKQAAAKKKVNVTVKKGELLKMFTQRFFSLHYQISVGGPIVKEDYAFSTPIYWVQFVFST